MSILRVKCSYCQRVFCRKASRVCEAKKFGWKQFCSLLCQSKYKSTAMTVLCDYCGQKFQRRKKLIGKNAFCTQSCAASFNNKVKPKRKKIAHPCLSCHELMLGSRKYCSKNCRAVSRRRSAKEVELEVVSSVVGFYKKNKRVPMKREMARIYKNARLIFGSWNKTISALGYTPNPVLFANKVMAEDGHMCDSIAEKLVDDWLCSNKISHERNVPYGMDKMTFDFKVGEIHIEYFGLAGNKQYDVLVKKKLRFWKVRNIKAIALYPKDLIPKNKLEKVLRPGLGNYSTDSR